MMNKNDIVDHMTKELDCTKSEAQKYLGAYINAIKEGVKNSEGVKIIGILSLTVEQRAARTGRNPKTGDPIKIPAKKVIKAKVGKELSDLVI